MSRKPEVRRGWLAAVVSDPLRKLLAIGLAVLLWLFLDAQLTKKEVSQVWILTGNQTLPAEAASQRSLRVDWPKTHRLEWLRDATQVDTEPDGDPADAQGTQFVHIELVGPTNTLRQLPPDLEFSVYLEPPKNPDSSSVVVEFGIEDIVSRGADERINRLLRTMTPTRIAVKLEEQGVSGQIPLSAKNVIARRPDGKTAKPSSLEFSRSSVSLRGPSLEVKSVQPTFVVNLKPGAETDPLLRGNLAVGSKWFDKFEIVESVTVTAPVRPDFLNLTLTVPVLLDTNLTPYGPEDFERPTPQEVSLGVASALRRELTDKTRAQLDEWARRNLRLCAVLPASTTLSANGESVRLDLFFLNPSTQRRRGVDYTTQRTSPIQVRPKKR